MKPMLSHINTRNQPGMVDISHKTSTLRIAEAEAILHLPQVLLNAIKDNDMASPKGPVFHTAIIAGTQAAKHTHALIPFCHTLPIEGINISIQSDGSALTIRCRVTCTHKTGVEMEALTGASVAALTIYDMCKAVSHEMIIKQVRLLEKTGGKSDFSTGD